jgi:hypothetical protein
MKYTGQYIWPPRPGGSLAPGCSYFNKLQQDPQWFAQAKMNGSNGQMVLIDNEPEWFNRHNAKLRFQPTKEQVAFFKSLEQFAPLVLNLESLTGKTSKFKQQLYVFDVLVFKGEWLVGSTVWERQALLASILPGDDPLDPSDLLEIVVDVGPQVWRAVNIETDWMLFIEHYRDTPGFEGLVLKQKTGKLEAGWREKNNSNWATRARVSDLK